MTIRMDKGIDGRQELPNDLQPLDLGARRTSGGVELQSLRKAYGTTIAVDDMTIAILPGEFFTILGPSGSGKTTTLMMVAGFAEPDSGRVLLDQRDITFLPPHRRNIGVVFQNYAIFPHMTVAQNVGFSLRMRDVSAADISRRVAAALDLVQLRGLEARYPRELSGGQQQRVALARALVFEPSLLLLDEPLGALDRMLREDMKLELRRVHRELGTSMIYVTHDQDEALVLSDRIIVMNAGRIEQIGTPTEIYEHPTNPFVARFIGESNFLRGTLAGKAGPGVAVVVDGVHVRGIPSGAIKDGDPVDLSVRPEKIVINPADDVLGEQLRGVVVDSIYSGDSVRYVVRLRNEVRLTVKEVRRASVPTVSSGEEVALAWSPQDAMVFPASL